MNEVRVCFRHQLPSDTTHTLVSCPDIHIIPLSYRGKITAITVRHNESVRPTVNGRMYTVCRDCEGKVADGETAASASATAVD